MWRGVRLLASGALGAWLVAVAVTPASAVVDFSSARRVGPPWTWNGGNALTHTGGYLQAAWASDCPPPRGVCATDSGPYMGVFVQRAGLRASPSWGKPVRVSQSKQQAARPTLVANGATVFAGWVTQTSYRHYAPRKRRVFYVRRGRKQGKRWGPAIRLSARRGRVDYPQLAASSGSVYAIWTNADTGDIRFATSTDRGSSWSTQTIGTTSSGSSAGEGYRGYPSVGVSGSNVLVTWFADDAGTQVAKVSNSGGADLAGASETTLTGTSPNDDIHLAQARGADDGSSDDVAVAYTTGTGLAVRTFGGGSLGPERDVLGSWPETVNGVDYDGSYGPAVQPYGNGGLLVGFPGCRAESLPNDCNALNAAARIDLLFSESTDGGNSWTTPPDRLADSSPTYRTNDAASITYAGSRRYVLFNEWNSHYTAYDLAMRVGTGTP